ncbi:hypothetical protein EDD36DRAFT_496134 [Exophiala viscosa]|uniref:Uncharacterized protein n=1 Tax=Exophiala viscosa TaxID=2486360 RepID=A0AAN6DXX4_9EURO|nr:hypothetical protein EDD36DRAFT_496134 [Exophiala viscosa]
MGVQPPFIYDKPSHYNFANPTSRAFNPKAATEASWAPTTSRPKQTGPLIDFNKHPDTYVVVPYGNLNAKPMHPNTEQRVTRARQVQLFLRACGLLGALGILFCVIAINKTSTTVGWIIRAAPAIAILHTIYGIHHLCRAATGRTPTSTASYMIFAALVDTSLLPFLVFSAWLSYADYTNNTYGWSTLFNEDAITYKIIHALFLLSCSEGGIILVSLVLDIYLGMKFKQIARLPPDMNPLEPNLTSRHKRNKSEGITEKNMKASALVAKNEFRESGSKRIPFIHTRTDSADSVTLYGSDSARNSRVELRKEIIDNEKDPWRWSRSSSPEKPNSVVNPSPNSRPAGTGLDVRPGRSFGLSRPSSWLSYVDYEGVPVGLSEEAEAELDHEVQPISPVSTFSPPRDEPRHKMQDERENWYKGSPPRNMQLQVPNNSSPMSNKSSRSSLHQTMQMPPPQLPPNKRSREPLNMNPPSPTRGQYKAQSMYSTPPMATPVAEVHVARVVLQDADGNAQDRPNMGPRPASFVGSGGKSRFYGSLRSSIGSITSQQDKKDANVSVHEIRDTYERTRTMQSESDYSSANFEVYASDSEEDDKVRAQVGHAPQGQQGQWNGARQTSNTTGYNLDGGYAGLSSEFGAGMGRRRDVSGKMAEEGRASPPKNGAAGWERFKGL